MADLLKTLNDLVSTCRDSEAGFAKAAKGAHSDGLRDAFAGIEAERSDFAEELGRLVRKLGGDPPAGGHLSGIQHKGWRELEESIRPKDDVTFLAECRTGEQNTLRHYEHALTLDLPPEVRAALTRQRMGIQTTLEELEEFEAERRAG